MGNIQKNSKHSYLALDQIEDSLNVVDTSKDSLNDSKQQVETSNNVYPKLEKKSCTDDNDLLPIARDRFGISVDELKEKHDTDGLVEYYIKKNYSKALEIFTEKKNYLMLGNLYSNKDYLRSRYDKAIYYYQLAINAGCSYALVNMGNIYYYGRGVEQSYTEAFKYFQRAAEMGNSKVLSEMGHMYHNGKGVEYDEYKALEYYEKAIQLGNHNVGKNLEYISQQTILIHNMRKQHQLEKTINQISKSLNDLNQKINDIVDYCSDNATVIIN